LALDFARCSEGAMGGRVKRNTTEKGNLQVGGKTRKNPAEPLQSQCKAEEWNPRENCGEGAYSINNDGKRFP